MLEKLLKYVLVVSTKRARKHSLSRVHKCENCGYQTDRDVAAAQVVAIRGLAAVGHTVRQCGLGGFPHEQLRTRRVKMQESGKFIGIPLKQESPG